VRFKLWPLLVLFMPLPTLAYWTGIGAYVGQGESGWDFTSGSRQADESRYGLHIEERTQSGLSIGASAGQFSLRLVDPLQLVETEKYGGQFLQFYLRWPVKLSESLTLHSRLDYQFNLGNRSGDTQDDEIDWNQAGITLGLALRLGLVSLRPFVNWSSIDGDMTEEGFTRVFENQDKSTAGIVVDIYVEPTAYVRLKGSAAQTPSFWLGFIREY